MALELRQQLKLSQQLVMTPQLQQAIKLLQLSRLELMDMVQNELLENPMLEEGVEEIPGERETELESERSAGEQTGEEDVMRSADWENYLGEFSSTARQVQGREYEVPEEGVSFEARLTEKPSLEGHLIWQLRLSFLDDRQKSIGEFIIGNLSSTGYLQASTEDMAAELEVDPEEVETVLHEIQRYDPVGVASRNPKECLLIQMDFLGLDDPVLVSLVTDHLEDLEKKRYKPLARKFRLSMDQLKEYLDMIQSLDPMPGSSYGSSEPQYVSPDAYVYKFDDEFFITLNDEGLPRLALNSLYVESMDSLKGTEKEYFLEKKRSALWLMKSLHQRQHTLYKVVESLVKFQRSFFEEGVTHLKPLILKDVADDINMHESTVSRITTSKYVATPHGVFELKFFFNSALELDSGGQVGSESVKALIKQLIDSEDARKPFSDEKIADILKERLQVNIARRTVAKYRSALNILSSSKRKQVF
jgi:RNA polymerase sigma-54 factor